MQKMTHQEIIDVQLESFFGNKFPQKIQNLVDEELNQGCWVEGYDLAISDDVVDAGDARKLLELVLEQNPTLRIDRDALLQLVEVELPQSMGASVLWIVEQSGAFALTDSLRVARFDGSAISWCSPRISFDGIVFDSLVDGHLRGRAWWPGSNVIPDFPFVFDFLTGELIEGQIVKA